MVLCCGEDPSELLGALPFKPSPAAYHEYRCYRFWRFQAFTLAWTGIGTGCLEPMLYELFEPALISGPKTIRRLILIGTAGSLNPAGTTPGQPYLIDPAYLGASAIGSPPHQITARERQPLRPRLGALVKRAAGLERRSIVSTDYYYGFSHDPASAMLREADPGLLRAVAAASGVADLVDMEVAQFYYFCGLLGGPSLLYLAIKGCANYVGGFSEQPMNSQQVLSLAMLDVFRLLSLSRSDSLSGPQ